MLHQLFHSQEVSAICMGMSTQLTKVFALHWDSHVHIAIAPGPRVAAKSKTGQQPGLKWLRDSATPGSNMVWEMGRGCQPGGAGTGGNGQASHLVLHGR